MRELLDEELLLIAGGTGSDDESEEEDNEVEEVVVTPPSDDGDDDDGDIDYEDPDDSYDDGVGPEDESEEPEDLGSLRITVTVGGQELSGNLDLNKAAQGLQEAQMFTAQSAPGEASDAGEKLSEALDGNELSEVGQQIADTDEIGDDQSSLGGIDLDGDGNNDIELTINDDADYYAYLDTDLDGDYDRRVNLGRSDG
ncbi:hypothetical protein P7A99_09495 [Caulobacter endophyticus]|nr:hypothetical protein [Caulobacter endophyticus]